MAKIHCQISEVSRENTMKDGMEWKWVTAFKDGHMNIHDEEQSGQNSVITEYFMQKFDKK